MARFTWEGRKNLGGFFTSTSFLRYGGIVLLALGVIGLLGLPGQSFFALTTGENVAHLGLGVVGLAAGYAIPNVALHRLLTVVVFATALVFGLWGFVLMAGGAFTPPATFATPNFYGLANLENPADNLLHLFVAAWSGFTLWRERAGMSAAQPAMTAR
jgi:hypothetical protein